MKMGSNADDFNVIQFEKRLTALKDSQDHINACCKWCLENRQYHKKIVISWLNVLKRVKIEQRLTLFYLANDVIQYSKRKHYEFVESWGTALQKATTLVRDDKVKHKIVRIFNIWQQRGVYNEEFISDLCGLISVVPTASKNDEPHEFQASYVTNKIKQCSKLETETDQQLKVLKEHNPKIQIDTDSLCSSLKDRAHVDDVEKEIEVYVQHLEGYINALKAEIKCRITNISVLKQANTHLDKDKKDVKVVANAYKVFGNKVKAFQKKLDEHLVTLASPVPSPDINAPSPSPDSDIELPDDSEQKSSDHYNPAAFVAGYYNPVPPPTTSSSPIFGTNGFTNFLGSNFDGQNLSTPTEFTTQTSTDNNNTLSNFDVNPDRNNIMQPLVQPPPPPLAAPEEPNFQYQGSGHLPLLPPPMPPFNPKPDYENTYSSNYSNSDKQNYDPPYNNLADTSFNSSMYDPQMNSFNNSNMSEYSNAPFEPPDGANPYPPSSEEYNPEQEPDTWDTDPSWAQPNDTDTPESPPNFEKEGYVEGIEYHDNAASGIADVDHRVLHPGPLQLDELRGRGTDVDHRNLISLTGSPADNSQDIPNQPPIWNQSKVDQDYRPIPQPDQDYRLTSFNIEQLKLPPPPPPPPKQFQFPNNKKPIISPRKSLDNVESIDMELSEDETEEHRNNMHSLKPPPPPPELPDDMDANNFLDDLDNDLNSNEFTANLHDPDQRNYMAHAPPRMNFPETRNMPPPPPNHFMPPNNWGPPPPPQQNFGFRGRGGFPNRGGNQFPPRGRSRGRGNFGYRGNNFRGRGFGRGGQRPHRPRGNMRGNFQGGF